MVSLSQFPTNLAGEVRGEMNMGSGYTVEDERLDQHIAEFMLDLDIALGHDYERPGRIVFPQFSPSFYEQHLYDTPLFERLASAYRLLEESRKQEALILVRGAYALCARSPQGFRRSLACIDLIHEIDIGFGGEELNSSLLLRPDDKEDLPEWVWELVRRWRRWNIKVTGSPPCWEVAMRIVAPKGIFELLSYFHEQNASNDVHGWQVLRRIALERIDQEEDALFDVGCDPEMLRTRILSQMVSVHPSSLWEGVGRRAIQNNALNLLGHPLPNPPPQGEGTERLRQMPPIHDVVWFPYGPDSADAGRKEREQLRGTVRPRLQRATESEQRDEEGWLDREAA
ncbi:MAG: hypothetical protein KJ558_01870 [Gammaproteobacteria bacterium]|nr:hypothetical protein [Gammaproteobacteria bacterium]MBU1653578.1 hypothetical protein [Gammaproteobacteria bacterium]MBU1962025.1 hypothetical protein [Gammaproteobacteria bacterium]